MIKYKIQGGYQLMDIYKVKTPLRPKRRLLEVDSYCILEKDGYLTIQAGYCWDGPSTGPWKKWSATKTFMRGSLVHDAMHQLARQNIWFADYKEEFDNLLQAHCLEDGMMKLRAWWVRRGVRMGKVMDPRPTHTAP